MICVEGRRMYEHLGSKGNSKTFAGKYYCYNLVFYEHFTHIEYAIEREKEIKKFRRDKKNKLIDAFNPEWKFLNEEVNE
jgi:putative endonuclease